jgi:ribokinase
MTAATTSSPAILVVGSMNMDLVLEADRIPSPGESYFGEGYRYIPGGKGANQAAASAKLGARVTFVGRIGDDPHGERLKANLGSQGISTEFIAVDTEQPTGLAVIFVEPSGENRIMVYGGANMRMAPEDAARALAGVPTDAARGDGAGSYDAVIMNFEIPDPVIVSVCERASELGIPVVIDAGPARRFDLSTLGRPEILSPNETETEALTGITCNSLDKAAEAARALADTSRARYVIIKMGSHGAFIHDPGAAPGEADRHVAAFDVDAVDATAAGDAFTAAVTIRYLSTGNLQEAVRYGNAAGALAVTRLGAQPSLPTREETERFLGSR